MVLRAILAVSFGGAMLASTSAYADWEYTEWGMSPEQVAAAAERAGSPIDEVTNPQPTPTGAVNLLTSRHEAAGHHFDVKFLFENNRLSLVSLLAHTPERCPELRRSIIQVYGEPESQDGIFGANTYRWRHREGGSMIELIDMDGSACALSYRRSRIDGL